jgi:hypothetical protein
MPENSLTTRITGFFCEMIKDEEKTTKISIGTMFYADINILKDA